jgi:hypothetical protein
VPIVKALGLAAVTVPDPPNEIDVPLTVSELFANCAFVTAPDVIWFAFIAIAVLLALVI